MQFVGHTCGWQAAAAAELGRYSKGEFEVARARSHYLFTVLTDANNKRAHDVTCVCVCVCIEHVSPLKTTKSLCSYSLLLVAAKITIELLHLQEISTATRARYSNEAATPQSCSQSLVTFFVLSFVCVCVCFMSS